MRHLVFTNNRKRVKNYILSMLDDTTIIKETANSIKTSDNRDYNIYSPSLIDALKGVRPDVLVIGGEVSTEDKQLIMRDFGMLPSIKRIIIDFEMEEEELKDE